MGFFQVRPSIRRRNDVNTDDLMDNRWKSLAIEIVQAMKHILKPRALVFILTKEAL